MILYKFYPPDSKSLILLKSGDISFRFSQKLALNDPFELTPYIDEYPIQINQSMEKKLENMELNDTAKSLIMITYNTRSCQRFFRYNKRTITTSIRNTLI